MTFHFQKLNVSGNPWDQNLEYVLVHVSLDPELAVIRFDVDMGSLPPLSMGGVEVFTNFRIANFDNNRTFFTDSNGLEM